jgi:hypothetical protein
MLNEALSVFLEREGHTLARSQSDSGLATEALISRIKRHRASRDIGDFDIRAAIEEGRD